MEIYNAYVIQSQYTIATRIPKLNGSSFPEHAVYKLEWKSFNMQIRVNQIFTGFILNVYTCLEMDLT